MALVLRRNSRRRKPAVPSLHSQWSQSHSIWVLWVRQLPSQPPNDEAVHLPANPLTHPPIHPSTHPSTIHPPILPHIQPSIHASIHPPTSSLTHMLMQAFSYSPTHSSIYSINHLLLFHHISLNLQHAPDPGCARNLKSHRIPSGSSWSNNLVISMQSDGGHGKDRDKKECGSKEKGALGSAGGREGRLSRGGGL